MRRPLYRFLEIPVAVGVLFLCVAQAEKVSPSKPPAHDSKTLSSMIELYSSLNPSSSLAASIFDSIAHGETSPEAKQLRADFLREMETQSRLLKETLAAAGYSEEEVRMIASHHRTAEHTKLIRKIDSTPYLTAQQLNQLKEAKTFRELEHALASAVKACDQWRVEHVKLLLL